TLDKVVCPFVVEVERDRKTARQHIDIETGVKLFRSLPGKLGIERFTVVIESSSISGIRLKPILGTLVVPAGRAQCLRFVVVADRSQVADTTERTAHFQQADQLFVEEGLV